MTKAKAKPANKAPAKRSGFKPTKVNLEKLLQQRDAEIERLTVLKDNAEATLEDFAEKLKAARNVARRAEAEKDKWRAVLQEQAGRPAPTLSQRIKAVFTG